MNKKIKISVAIAALLVCTVAVSCSQKSEEVDNFEDSSAVAEVKTEQVLDADSEEQNEAKISTDSENVTDEKEDTADNETLASENGLKTELIHCVFTDVLYAQDRECIGQYYQDRTGEVYVDLAIAVQNPTDSTFGSSNLSGYFMHDDLRYDMAFGYEDASCTSISVVSGLALAKDCIPAHSAGVAHLVGIVEDAAKGKSIEVHYTIDGKEYTQKVSFPSSNYDLTSNKTKISVGKKFNVNGLYDIEVMSCDKKSYISAYSVKDGAQYEPTQEGKDFFDLVVKIKNNSVNNLDSVLGYTVINGTYIPAAADVESKALVGDDIVLSAFSAFSNYIAPGEEKYVHVYTLIDENQSEFGLSMRFNLGGEMFYCPIAY